MTTQNTQDLNMAEIRRKLRESREGQDRSPRKIAKSYVPNQNLSNAQPQGKAGPLSMFAGLGGLFKK